MWMQELNTMYTCIHGFCKQQASWPFGGSPAERCRLLVKEEGLGICVSSGDCSLSLHTPVATPDIGELQLRTSPLFTPCPLKEKSCPKGLRLVSACR